MRRCWRRCHAVALAGVVAGAAIACEPGLRSDPRPSLLHVRIDNDFLGGLGQDGGYTNGFQVSVVFPGPASLADASCLPLLFRGVHDLLDAFTPSGVRSRQLLVGFGQGLFTPTDRRATDLLRDDRPYAAVLLAGLGYNVRRDMDIATTQLRVGVVGPSALGEQVQNSMHHLFGAERVEGWSNQLRDEPVVQLLHERLRRRRAYGPGNWTWDAIGHWGGSLGNLFTWANAGGELRTGRNLPDDFGSDPFRPSGELAGLPPDRSGGTAWGAHLFVSFDARLVARNLTLDGNTWQASHHVQRRWLVADFGHGFALTHGPWKLAFARYYRTREFDGQTMRPVFGSIIVSRRF